MSLLPLLTGILGGLIGGLLGGFANYARHRWDLHGKRIETFCAEVERTADRATAYWLRKVDAVVIVDGARLQDDGFTPLTVDQEKAAAEVGLSEAQIVSSQMKLARTGALIRDKLDRDQVDQYDALIASLFDSLTGGDFQSRSSVIDQERATSVQFNAAQLIAHIRLSSEKYFTLGQALGYSWLQESFTRMYGHPRAVRMRHLAGRAWSRVLRGKPD